MALHLTERHHKKNQYEGGKKTSDFSPKYVKRKFSLSCHEPPLDSAYVKEERIL